MRQGWYLQCKAGDIAERVVLVGDPGRVEVFGRHLEGARTVNADRALLTSTGQYNGVPVTVAAFGMGAPIMAVVLEEVAWLGAQVVLRAGTAMAVADPAWLGHFSVPVAALRGEHTSATYVPPEYPAAADPTLVAHALAELERLGRQSHGGLMASYDGFYSELFLMAEEGQQVSTPQLGRLRALGVEAADMETSALLAIGRYRGLRCASLCAITVDMETRRALRGEERARTEEALVRAALETVSKG